MLHFVCAIFTGIPVYASGAETTVVTQASHCWITNNLRESTQKYQVLASILITGFTILSSQTILFINCKILTLFHTLYFKSSQGISKVKSDLVGIQDVRWGKGDTV